jgi:hypothetical protein
VSIFNYIPGGNAMEINKIDSFTEWTNWKDTLSKAVNLGESFGMSENTIENIATKIGNVLAARVDPENREQRLLQELWKVGDDSDRKVLAKLIVKMVETDVKQ